MRREFWLAALGTSLAFTSWFTSRDTSAEASRSTHMVTQVGVVDTGRNPSHLSTPVRLLAIDEQPRCTSLAVAVAVAEPKNDDVFVLDACDDGRSAVGEVRYYHRGHEYRLLCRNDDGEGVTVRCHWNWPEGPRKRLIAAAKSYPDGQYIVGSDAPTAS